MKLTRQTVFTALRAVIGMGLAAFLIQLTLKKSNTSLADLQAQWLGANRVCLALAFVFYGVVLALTIWRWDLLLRVQGVHLRRWDLFRLTMIGVFFNLAIPGAVSGDLVKMGYIAGEVPAKKAECILTIMLDRVIGLLGLLVTSSVVILFCLPFVMSLGAENRALQVAALLVGFGGIGGIVAVLLVELRGTIMRHPLLARLTAWFAGHLPHGIVGVVERLISALELYRQRRAAIAVALLLSVMVHSTLAMNLFLIGRAVGEQNLVLKDYFLATQVSNAVASIPLTPAGVGLRDFGIKKLFEAMHATPGTIGVVPITQTFVIVFWGLVGAVVFVFAARKLPHGPPPATDSPPQGSP